MAKDLAAMTTEFNNIKRFAEQNVAAAEQYNTQKSDFNTSYNARIKAIEARVAQMKKAGEIPSEGNSLISGIVTKLHSFDAVIQKMANYDKQYRTPLVRRVTTLETDLGREVTARSKAVSTKVGVGNKSLPDLKKLQTALAAFKKTSDYTTIAKWQLDNEATWGISINSDIKKALG